jgi:hypothetical protein
MIDVYSMELDEISRAFNARDYPTVQSVKDALPRSLRGVVHGNNRDEAVRQVVEEVRRLRGVSRLTDIFKK